MHIKQRGGFSLLEMLVVGALASIFMVAIVTLITNMTRAQKSGSQSVDFENVATVVRMALQNSTTCPAAMQTSAGVQVAPPTTVTVANPDLPATGISIDKLSIGTLLVDTAIPYSGVTISKIAIMQVVAGVPSAAASPEPYITFLRIEGTKPGTPSGTSAVGGGFLRKDIPLQVTIRRVSGTPTIISCTSSFAGAGGSGGNWAAVAFTGAPTCNANLCGQATQGDRSPQQICTGAGYTNFAGSCRGTTPAGTFGAPAMAFQGSVVANKLSGVWYLSCHWGDQRFYMPDEILCF